MKVKVLEIEEYEITDPAGCCNPPVPKPKQFPGPMEMEPQYPKPVFPTFPATKPLPAGGRPNIPGHKWGDEMEPMEPKPVVPNTPGHLWWNIPGGLFGETADIKPAQFPTINTKRSPDPLLREQWGIGTPMIQRARDNFRAAVDRKVEEDHGNSFTG